MDLDCDTMLYCHWFDDKCAPAIPLNQPCSGYERCAFGSLCNNGTCTAYGSVPNKGTIDSVDNDMLCSSFFADTKDDDYAYCGIGPKNNFDNMYKRTGDDLNCSYNYYDPITEEHEYKNYTAICGPNSDDYFYCPKQRGDEEFSKNLTQYQALWQETNYNCHVESSIVYCKDIIDKGKQKQMTEFLINYVMTDGESYPTFANNPDCVKKMINFYFYEIEDIINSSNNKYITLYLGLISVLLLALLN